MKMSRTPWNPRRLQTHHRTITRAIAGLALVFLSCGAGVTAAAQVPADAFVSENELASDDATRQLLIERSAAARASKATACIEGAKLVHEPRRFSLPSSELERVLSEASLVSGATVTDVVTGLDPRHQRVVRRVELTLEDPALSLEGNQTGGLAVYYLERGGRFALDGTVVCTDPLPGRYQPKVGDRVAMLGFQQRAGFESYYYAQAVVPLDEEGRLTLTDGKQHELEDVAAKARALQVGEGDAQ